MGYFAEQTQVGIYKAASEEGASKTWTPLTEGPPPASCLQAGNPARQRYIVLEGQERVVSRPPGAAREGPVNYPWEKHLFRGSPLNAGRRCQTPFGESYYQSGGKLYQSSLGLRIKGRGFDCGRKESQENCRIPM